MGRDAFDAGLKLAIIDEHDIARTGLQCWLAADHPQLTASETFSDYAGYLARRSSGLEVDVVVTEIQWGTHAPDIAGLRVLCATAAAVIVYSRIASDEVVLSSLENGAASYVAKADGKAHLLAALRCVADGGAYQSPRMAAALNRSTSGGRINLSEREKQVLAAWFQTESKDDVGRRLRIAPATVRTHLQRVRAKYAAVGRTASTKSALLARAIEDGIIGLSDLDVGSGQEARAVNVLPKQRLSVKIIPMTRPE